MPRTPQSRFGSVVVYLYLLRVQIVVTIILVGFPVIALANWPLKGRPLFENLFVLTTFGSAIATLGAFMLAWSLVLTSLVVLLNAEDRFGVRQSGRLTQAGLVERARLVRWIVAVLVMASATPMAVAQFVQSGWDVPRDNMWGVVAGGLGAYVLAFVSLWVAAAASPASMRLANEVFPAPRFLRRILERAHPVPEVPVKQAKSLGRRTRAVRERVWRRVSALLLKLPKDLSAGYIDRRPVVRGEPNPGYGLPWSGVWFAAVFALTTFVVYYAIGYYRQAHFDRAVAFPALAFVILLLLNANWIFSFLAYFLDRYRVPLLIPWAVLATFSAYSASSDHYYRLQPSAAPIPVGAHEGVAAKVRSDRPIVVVTTAGGGIQAAMWTVRVLTGLQSRASTATRSFADSVALISAVSGGAAGALFFASQYEDPRIAGGPSFRLRSEHDIEKFYAAVGDAWHDSLDDVAWALVYRDVPRILFPYLPTRRGLFLPVESREGEFLDRGRMLELSWQRQHGGFGKLSDWRAGVAEGWRPAMIFNATIAETGEPFLFSTTDLARPRAADNELFTHYERRSFADFYAHFDVDLVTATRLASGFPFVLPAPRARAVIVADGAQQDERDKTQVVSHRYHLIDGGYYDNYGVTTAARWIDDVLTRLEKENEPFPRSVLIVQIRPFPSTAIEEPKERGWPFQVYSPLSALLSVRESGQLLHAKEELLALRDKWGRGPDELPLIKFATFEFSPEGAPLSFRMNPTQERQIKTLWESPTPPIAQSLQTVQCVIDPKARADCPKLAYTSMP
jgi:hypothetical protein